MSDSPKLALPEIAVDQASKYITHNEALRVLDALVQATIIDKDLYEAPASPSDGDTYIVAATPASDDDWAGETDSIAYFSNTAWIFVTPEVGWRVWVQDENVAYLYQGDSSGGGWVLETDALVGVFTGMGDTPSSYSGQSLNLVRVNDGETALEFTEDTYDIAVSYGGVPPGTEQLLRMQFVRSVEFADDFAGSYGIAGSAATAQAVFTIKLDGVQVGTITFAIGATTATFATTSGVLAIEPGEVLLIQAPSSPDATLADIGFTLKGAKI